MADRNQVAQALLSNYTPSWREQIGNSIYDVARALMPSTANRMREEAMMAVDFIPGVGDAVGLNDAYNDFNAGNYGLAAAGLGATAAGVVPGVGDAVGKGIKTFEDYLRAVNPSGIRIPSENRPNLGLGDMYGMLPKGARVVDSRFDPDYGNIKFYREGDNYYATAMNPDIGEMDVVGYAMPSDREMDLMVVEELQGKGIGSNLQYLLRSGNPYQQTGGLTEGGEAALRKTYDRLVRDGILP